MAAATDLPSFAEQRARYSALRCALTATVYAATDNGDVVPMGRDLVEACTSYSQAECAALVWTACRWSELPTIDWRAVATGAPARISMPKVKRTRRGPTRPASVAAVWHEVPSGIALPQRRRATVASHIRDALDRLDLYPPAGIQSGTHAVRHLIASARRWDGQDIDEIRRHLGHSSSEATAEYVHDKEAWRSP